MRQNVSATLEVSRLELLRHGSIYGDLQARAAFQQSLEETVLTWFHDHPGREAACRLQSEGHFVALAFEQFWQIVAGGMRDTLRGVGLLVCESERGHPGDVAGLLAARSSLELLAKCGRPLR